MLVPDTCNYVTPGAARAAKFTKKVSTSPNRQVNKPLQGDECHSNSGEDSEVSLLDFDSQLEESFCPSSNAHVNETVCDLDETRLPTRQVSMSRFERDDEEVGDTENMISCSPLLVTQKKRVGTQQRQFSPSLLPSSSNKWRKTSKVCCCV